jgi:hypothetical protein
VALVEGARQLGFEFRSRTRSHLTVSFQGREVRASHGLLDCSDVVMKHSSCLLAWCVTYLAWLQRAGIRKQGI